MFESKVLYLVTSNEHKISECQTLFGQYGYEIMGIDIKIKELQTQDSAELVRDKALKAFQVLQVPLLVEHTGISLDAMGGFPSGLTQCMWDSMLADRFCELFGGGKRGKVTARTDLVAVDGRRLLESHGEVLGSVSDSPKGNRDFQWDCIFVPDGFDKTFAELGEYKNKISMRKIAVDNFAKRYLND